MIADRNGGSHAYADPDGALAPPDRRLQWLAGTDRSDSAIEAIADAPVVGDPVQDAFDATQAALAQSRMFDQRCSAMTMAAALDPRRPVLAGGGKGCPRPDGEPSTGGPGR